MRSSTSLNRLRYKTGLRVCLLGALFALQVPAQSGAPAREYIRMGGRVVAVENGPQQAPTPTFSPGGGTYQNAQTVTIASSLSGAQIHYSTNGETPTATSSPSGLSPVTITVSATSTVRAIAVKTGYAASDLGAATFNISALPQAATPSFNIPAGTYSAAQTVEISSATPGATIHYTTNGTAPSATSAPYGAAPLSVTVGATSTLQAIAVKDGYADSAIASAVYTILPLIVGPGTATLYAGGTLTLTANQTAAWSLSGPGAISTAGPSTTTVYTAPNPISGTQSAAVTATADGGGTASTNITLQQAPADPTVTPGSGSVFPVGQPVTFTVFGPGSNWNTDSDWLTILVNSSNPTGSQSFPNSCYITYKHSTGTVYLVADDGYTYNLPALSGTIGSSAVLGAEYNSQCSVALGASTATLTSNGLTLALSVTFKQAFVGGRYLWASSSHPNWDWRSFGSVTISDLTPTVTPGNGSVFTVGQPVTFSVFGPGSSWTTTDDWLTLLISPSSNNGYLPSACYVTYRHDTSEVMLAPDNGGYPEIGLMGSNTTLGQYNSQCSLSLSQSTAVLTSSGLTMNLSITFKSGFAGSRSLWVSSSHPNYDWRSFGWVTIAASQIGVSVTPDSVSMIPGHSQQFAAAVTGTSNANVTWSVSSGPGTITSGGMYSAPAPACGASSQTVGVRATSQADPTRYGSAAISLGLPDSLTLASQTIASGQTVCRATGEITAGTGVTVSGSATVSFQAGSSITLAPGFQATPGAGGTFTASIDPEMQ
jgi:hypothetical protein